MIWEMEVHEMESVLEKIWDLHDKLSDTILSISRTHFLSSIKSLRHCPDKNESDEKTGFVFVKGFRVEEDDDADDCAVREAKSLNAIRTALENLKDQLEFFHMVQTQQRAERDAALQCLEQSRIVLAMRLSEHQGSEYKVIDEAKAFVGNVRNATHNIQQTVDKDNVSKNKYNPNIFFKFLVSGYNLAKQTLKLDRMGRVLGHTGLVAASMIALLHLHQVTCKNKFVLDRNLMEEDYGKTLNRKRSYTAGNGSSSGTISGTHLDVLLARG